MGFHNKTKRSLFHPTTTPSPSSHSSNIFSLGGNRLFGGERWKISSLGGCGGSVSHFVGSGSGGGGGSGCNNDSDDDATNTTTTATAVRFRRTWQRCWWLSNQIVFVTLLFLVTMSPVGLVRGEITCPPYQEIPYCSCFVLDDQLHIQCSGSDIPALKKSLQVLNGPVKSYSVYDLDARATILPDGVTDNVTSPVFHVQGLEDGIYLMRNGKLLHEDDQVKSLSPGQAVVTILRRVLGGKGGFGSMLRAIGAQIEKTTNRDACRDLSGRRLRDINEEQRLKKWFTKQAEREKERVEAKKRKLEKLRQFAEGPALPKIDDQEYLKKRENMVDEVFDAVDKGFEARKESSTLAETTSESSNSCPLTLDQEGSVPSGSKDQEIAGSSSGSSSAAGTSKSVKPVQKQVKKTMFDEDLDSGSSTDDSSEDEEEASAAKKAKVQ